MKRFWLSLVLVAALIVPAFAMTVPEPTGYVVDTTGTLKPETVAHLTQICRASEPKVQMAVLMVDTIAPEAVEYFGIKVAEKWKVGFKGQDNGIILIIVKKDRKIRIEVGRGAEGFFPDFKAGQVIDEMKPLLKRGQENWAGAVVCGLQAIQRETK